MKWRKAKFTGTDMVVPDEFDLWVKNQPVEKRAGVITCGDNPATVIDTECYVINVVPYRDYPKLLGARTEACIPADQIELLDVYCDEPRMYTVAEFEKIVNNGEELAKPPTSAVLEAARIMAEREGVGNDIVQVGDNLFAPVKRTVH